MSYDFLDKVKIIQPKENSEEKSTQNLPAESKNPRLVFGIIIAVVLILAGIVFWSRNSASQTAKISDQPLSEAQKAEVAKVLQAEQPILTIPQKKQIQKVLQQSAPKLTEAQKAEIEKVLGK